MATKSSISQVKEWVTFAIAIVAAIASIIFWVQSADDVKQTGACGEVGFDGGVEVLDAVQAKQFGMFGVLGVYLKAAKRSVDGIDNYGVFGPLFRAGHEALAEGSIGGGRWVAWCRPCERCGEEALVFDGGQTFGGGADEVGGALPDTKGGASGVGVAQGRQQTPKVGAVGHGERPAGHGFRNASAFDDV